MVRKAKYTVLIMVDGLPAGGTERQIVELLKGLKEHDDITTALGILQKNGEREREAVFYADILLPIKQSKACDATVAYSLINLIKRFHIDLIHTFGSISDFSGIVAGKIAKVPVINGSIRSARPCLNVRDRISKLCMRYADWVVANSAAGLRAFNVEAWSNSSVVYNGIDVSRFQGHAANNQDRSICMVGNFTKKKDHESLIKALPHVLKRFPDTRLTLVGRGKNERRCRGLASTLGVESQVTFENNCNNPDEVIRTCAVGVLLSPGGEGLSNVLLEYMALGLPVIATDLGGNREIVEHGLTGILLPDHSTQRIAEAIENMFEMPEKAQQMGSRGRERVEKRFGCKRMIREYVDLYSQVLSRH